MVVVLPLIGCDRSGTVSKPLADALHRAEVLHEAEDFAGAVAAYSEAIRLDPASANTYHARGTSWLAAGEYDRAIDDFSAAVRLAPKRATYYGSRALAHYAKQEYDRAIEDNTTAIRYAGDVHPKDLARMYYCRALAYLGKGDTTRAEADLAKAGIFGPPGPA
jgi:tetratricopeptide (TPR) repeat protein